MEQKKYIIFKDGTKEVFSRQGIHLFVADDRPVVSAGFIDFDEDRPIKCYGESTTLGVESREDDLDIFLNDYE